MKNRDVSLWGLVALAVLFFVFWGTVALALTVLGGCAVASGEGASATVGVQRELAVELGASAPAGAASPAVSGKR